MLVQCPDCGKKFEATAPPQVVPGPATQAGNTLFRPVRTIQVSAVESFVPGDLIKLGVHDGVKVVYVGPELEGLIQGLAEENIPAGDLQMDVLSRTGTCAQIHEALAGRRAFIADLWGRIKLQPTGTEPGELHIDGKANLIEVEINGVAWLVDARVVGWYDERGWVFYAVPADDASEWGWGRLLLSRDRRPVPLAP